MNDETKSMTETEARIQALRNTAHEASTLRRDREEIKDEWFRAKRAEIYLEAAQLYDAGISEAMKLERTAMEALEDALYAEALINPGKNVPPVGTTVMKSKMARYGSHAIGTLYGIVEVWGKHSVRPNNRSIYPSVGRVVVRLLKADGTASKDYDDSCSFDPASSRCWKVVTDGKQSA